MKTDNYFMYSFLQKVKHFFHKNLDIVISTFIIGLIAHAYCFLNYLPTWDGIINTNSVGATFSSGRWLLKYVGSLFSDSTLPWINGLLSLLFICISVILIAEIFDIQDRIYRVIIAGLFVTFPSVTSTFVFMFTADCYFLAFLLSVLAAYLCYKYSKYGFIGAIPLISGSIGIYQSYMSVYLVIVTIMIICDTVIKQLNLLDLIKKYYKSVIAFVTGFVLYEVILHVFLHFKKIELSSYQGINEVGLLSPFEMLRATAINAVKFLSIFGIELFDIEGRPFKLSLYSIICIVILLATAILAITVTIKKKLLKRPINLILFIFELFLMFVFTFILRYSSTNVAYSSPMEIQVCLYFVITFIFINELSYDKKFLSGVKSLSIFAFCALIICNAVSSNSNYFYMHLRYERTYSTALKVIDDISAYDGYKTQDKKIAVIGADFKTSNNCWNYSIPYIRGSGNDDTLLISQNHYVKFWHYFIGIDVTSATDDEIERIKELETFKEMPSYPDDGYISEINGIIVAKISEK